VAIYGVILLAATTCLRIGAKLSLLAEKRFAPFFWTQFLGAFTDNAFKQALILMITFKGAMSEAETGQLIAIASGLFVLPFFLFSPLAGQISDKFEKATVMRRVKLVEIIIMLLAAAGFTAASLGYPYANQYLIGILFLMGTQSTFFGPVKYSIIPQHVRKEELMEGTALIESGTFVAILTGTIVGGILIMHGNHLVSLSLVGFAVVGFLCSCGIPEAPASNPQAVIRWNWIHEYKHLYQISKQKPSVYLSIIGISWFWFLGAMVMAQLPNFVRLFVYGDESMYIFFLSLFTLSIALGAVLTDWLADSSIELGMVPLGAIGLTLFPLDIGLFDYSKIPPETLTFGAFMTGQASAEHLRIIFDIMFMGISSSFYIVPLYALLQHRTAEESRSQVIAANNIAGALFMVVSAATVSSLYAFGLDTAELFVVLALLNTGAGIYLCAAHSEFLLRSFIWLLGLTFYRVHYEGRANIPEEGGALLFGRNSGALAWCGITSASDRPVRFAIDATGAHRWSRLFHRLCRAIPLGTRESENRDAWVATIQKALNQGDLVCALDSEAPEEIARLLEELDLRDIPAIPIEVAPHGPQSTDGRRKIIRIKVGTSVPLAT
jgi:MFS family permease